MKNIIFAILTLSVAMGPSFEAQAKRQNSHYQKSKQECLSEGPQLKGKKLQGCIKKKQGFGAKKKKKSKQSFND